MNKKVETVPRIKILQKLFQLDFERLVASPFAHKFKITV